MVQRLKRLPRLGVRMPRLGEAPAFVSRYWRMRATAGWTGTYWDLENDGNAQRGVFASSDLTGTDLGAALAVGSTLDMLNPDGSSGRFTGSGSGNFFNTGDRSYIASALTNTAIWMDFGADIVIGSLSYSNLNGDNNRKPTAMALEYSGNNVVWNSYASLTDDRSGRASRWQSITLGGTIANS